MLRVAVRSQGALGLNDTSNVALPPPGIGETGCRVTVKSAAWGPLTATLGVPVRSSGRFPAFLMVNVRVTVPLPTAALPKSV